PLDGIHGLLLGLGDAGGIVSRLARRARLAGRLIGWLHGLSTLSWLTTCLLGFARLGLAALGCCRPVLGTLGHTLAWLTLSGRALLGGSLGLPQRGSRGRIDVRSGLGQLLGSACILGELRGSFAGKFRFRLADL